MSKLLLALFVGSLAGCAARSYSSAIEPTAPFGFGGGLADKCVFGHLENVCLRGVVATEGPGGLESDVVAGIRRHLPAFESHCGSPDRTDVMALVGADVCIDCGPGAPRARLRASATVTAFQTGIGEVDSVSWVDERGGTYRQAAYRLGLAVGEFVVDSAKACMPPNQRLQPSARGGKLSAPRLNRGR